MLYKSPHWAHFLLGHLEIISLERKKYKTDTFSCPLPSLPRHITHILLYFVLRVCIFQKIKCPFTLTSQYVEIIWKVSDIAVAWVFLFFYSRLSNDKVSLFTRPGSRPEWKVHEVELCRRDLRWRWVEEKCWVLLVAHLDWLLVGYSAERPPLSFPEGGEKGGLEDGECKFGFKKFAYAWLNLINFIYIFICLNLSWAKVHFFPNLIVT